MEVGAISQVLKDVGCIQEWRHADPAGALPAHLRYGHRWTVGHGHRHSMAADPAESETSLRKACGGVMWAARTERRKPHEVGRRLGDLQRESRAGAGPRRGVRVVDQP